MKTNSIFLSSAAVQMRGSLSRSMYQFCLLVSPLVSTILLGEMYRGCSPAEFTSYVVLGTGLMSLWGCICFSSASDIDRERWSNTLSVIFVSPGKFQTILRGKIFGNTILSLGSLVLTALYALILYRRPLVIESPVLFAASLLLIVVSFSEVSVLLAYLLAMSRKSWLYMNCIDIPVILLCGFAFPVEMLPMWCRWVSFALPPTWGVKLLRLCVDGSAVVGEYLLAAGLLVLTTAVFSVASRLAYGAIVRQVKIRATLEVA